MPRCHAADQQAADRRTQAKRRLAGRFTEQDRHRHTEGRGENGDPIDVGIRLPAEGFGQMGLGAALCHYARILPYKPHIDAD
jgi:hypothetical protein